MGWVKAKIKQAMGSKKEADGIALRNEELKERGRREREQARAQAAALREASRHHHHRRDER